MSRLNKYARKSDLMNVQIKYGDEMFRFNLYQETKIKEESINQELQNQPSSYAFLIMLHKKLIGVKSSTESLKDRAYAKAFIGYKTSVDDSTGRATSKEVAKEKAQIHKKYIEAEQAYLKANLNCNIIEACVRAFEQRKDILQTLSANQRKERV